jgi:pSer/pThr/pTyr-binding forkhead associated (FHA) protein
MWLLKTPENDDAPFTFRVLPGSMKTIGRATRADFIVDVALVSRVHCRLTEADGKLEVEDLGSTNGTFVNDRRVKRAVLAPGDRLRIGRVELLITRDKGAADAAPDDQAVPA